MISGTIEPTLENLEITIVGLEEVYKVYTGKNGSWDVEVEAPASEGRFMIWVISGSIVEVIQIQVEDTSATDDVDDDDTAADDDTGTSDKEGFLSDTTILIGFIVLLVLIFMAFNRANRNRMDASRKNEGFNEE